MYDDKIEKVLEDFLKAVGKLYDHIEQQPDAATLRAEAKRAFAEMGIDWDGILCFALK